ncbi:hypothetical protein QAD02_012245 [Eretmocerus hayati]|uniref:Uncharacterized protein n=1 Tax=Eretmocerus hayati TaxID=131215 RepID=A0ACC2P011_9HYME|nr:hypothetical protein QAD02_012245 [Eretmocerus hayati]
MCDVLGDPRLREIIKKPPSNPPYDAVLVQLMNGYQCFSAIGYLWNVPVIGIVTTALQPHLHHFVGQPLNLAISSKKCANLQRKHDILGQALQFSCDSFHHLRVPKIPAHVEIGGIHIQDDNSTIDLELKNLLDESEHGFIYFSFGTVTVLESFPKEVLEKFFAAFHKISPVRVIVKSTNSTALTRHIDKNIFTFSWLPQQRILQHPNIKGFVSHGGGLGSQEAVYFSVPLICVPLFDDQFINCDISSEKGYGIKLDIRTAQQTDYDNAFTEILHNPKYQTSVKRVSGLYRDRPIKPKNEAVYWIEYVIRHGKQALKSPAVDLKWWQIELFDVYAFIVSIFTLTIVLIFFAIRRALKLLSLLRTNLIKQNSSKKSD